MAHFSVTSQTSLLDTPSPSGGLRAGFTQLSFCSSYGILDFCLPLHVAPNCPEKDLTRAKPHPATLWLLGLKQQCLLFTACCHCSVNPASLFAACWWLKLSTYLLFAFKYSPLSSYGHLIVNLFLCYKMKSFPRPHAHKLYVSNNVSAEKWKKKEFYLNVEA